MAKDKARKASEAAEIILPLGDQIFSKLKRDPVTKKTYPLQITITLTIQPEGHDGALHIRGNFSRPRVKRLKGGAGDAA